MTLTHDVPHGSTWGNLGQPGATWGNLGQPGATHAATRSTIPLRKEPAHGQVIHHSRCSPRCTNRF
jgi:hypothetical protein